MKENCNNNQAQVFPAEQYNPKEEFIRTNCESLLVSNKTDVTIEVNGFPILPGKALSYVSRKGTPFTDPFSLKYQTTPTTGLVYAQRINGGLIPSFSDNNYDVDSVSAADSTMTVNPTTGAVTVKVNQAANFAWTGTQNFSGATVTGIPSSVSAADTTVTVNPITGAVTVKINLANINTWTGKQTFSGGVNLGTSSQTVLFSDSLGNISTSISFNYDSSLVKLIVGGIVIASGTSNIDLSNGGGTSSLTNGSLVGIGLLDSTLQGGASGTNKRLLVTRVGCPRSNDNTATRALNTVYTNANGQALMVMATVRCAISVLAGNAYIQGFSDGNADPSGTPVSGIVGIQAGLLNEDNTFQVCFVVKPGDKYEIISSTANGTTTLGKWFEQNF